MGSRIFNIGNTIWARYHLLILSTRETRHLKMKTSLLKAIRIVSRMDSSPIRGAVFSDICKRSWTINFVARIYQVLSGTPIGNLLIGLYGAKAFLSLSTTEKRNATILATWTYPNEKKQIEYLHECLGTHVELQQSEARWSSELFTGVNSIISSPKAVLKYLRIIKLHCSIYSFMPACRIASTIGYYFYFSQLLSKRTPNLVIVASNYSPQSVALRWSAKAIGIPAVFISHAAIARIESLPPLDAELSILDGPAAREAYNKLGTVIGDVVYSGIPGPSNPLKIAAELDNSSKAGIFLTALTDEVTLAKTVEVLLKQWRFESVLIRPHPVSLVGPSEDWLASLSNRVKISKGSSLAKDCQSCNLVVCGDTSSHLEILKLGVPTIYLSKLDSLPEDYYNFVRHKIVPKTSSLEDLSWEELKEHYSNDWADNFRFFDSSYLLDQQQFKINVKNAISKLNVKQS